MPWMDAGFRQCRSLRRKNMKILGKKQENQENRKKYVDQRKLCAEMSITKQKVYYSNLINTSENEQHTLFKIVNVLLDKNKTRSYPDHHENPQKLADDFNEFYLQKLKKIYLKTMKITKQLELHLLVLPWNHFIIQQLRN